MNLIRRFMRFFFYHFYHDFAWSYDFVATVVSIGRWDEWVKTALPYVQGSPILEIGHGPGHLQGTLRDENGFVVGLDESPQMGQLASKRLNRAGFTEINLTRGVSQALPFPTDTFSTVVSTFPAEYIFDAQTQSEVYRVLCNGGHFVVTPAAWIVGRATLDRMAAWLFRITGQSPSSPIEVIRERVVKPFQESGFLVKAELIEKKSSVVLLVLAEKPDL